MVSVAVKRLPHNADLPLPEYESVAASGMDLPAAIENDLIIAPGERQLVPTGLAIALPEGYEAQIRPRSGLALRNGVTILNTPGTIDSDYRGEVKVILVPHRGARRVGDHVAGLVGPFVAVVARLP